jgi:hypothetical protein
MVNAMAHFFMFMDELSGFCSRRILSICVPRCGLLFFIALLFISFLVSAESLREYHQRKCDEGITKNCGRAKAMLAGEQYADRIVELGDNFAIEIDRSTMEEENKPLLKKAYLDVLNDYFGAEPEHGIKRLVAREMINLCADHYNDHWRNKKMWWPTNDAGEPDWSTIYFYIIDHYYGYCLRSIQ